MSTVPEANTLSISIATLKNAIRSWKCFPRALSDATKQTLDILKLQSRNKDKGNIILKHFNHVKWLFEIN